MFGPICPSSNRTHSLIVGNLNVNIGYLSQKNNVHIAKDMDSYSLANSFHLDMCIDYNGIAISYIHDTFVAR